MPTNIAIVHTAAHPAFAGRPMAFAARLAALPRFCGADIALLAVVAAAVVLGIAAMADALAAPVALDAVEALAGFAGL